MCTVDSDGHVSDEQLHWGILNNADADLFTRETSYKRAVAEGVSVALARAIYGITHG
jgi:hypothetical protein